MECPFPAKQNGGTVGSRTELHVQEDGTLGQQGEIICSWQVNIVTTLVVCYEETLKVSRWRKLTEVGGSKLQTWLYEQFYIMDYVYKVIRSLSTLLELYLQGERKLTQRILVCRTLITSYALSFCQRVNCSLASFVTLLHRSIAPSSGSFIFAFHPGVSSCLLQQSLHPALHFIKRRVCV